MTAISNKIYSMEPVLEVNNLEETLQYYQEVLGFSVDWTWPDEKPANHASVSFGVGHNSSEHEDYHIHIQLSQAQTIPVANSGWLYFRVNDDIDQLYEEFKKRDANIISEIGDRSWGMREFDIRDNNGHHFRFAVPLPE